MEFDPIVYDKSNYDTLLPAKRLVEVINKMKINNNKHSVILDIGCGTGNMTKLLSQIDCDYIIGCDIDPKMIEFAKSNNSLPQTEYLVQDISAVWEKLDEKLKKLYGKVSIVSSNFSLTWIKDKQIETVAQNISNLLSDEGIVVLNIVYDGDIFKRLSPEEKAKIEKLVKYPTEHELIGKWFTSLKNVGLNRIDIQYWEPKVIVSEKLYIEEYIKIPMNWYKSYSNVTNGSNPEVDQLLKRLLIEDRCKKVDLINESGEQQIEVTNYLWQIVAKKSQCLN